MYIDNKLTHAYVIHEMMIRTLERDLKHISNLKTEEVLTKLYEKNCEASSQRISGAKKANGRKGNIFSIRI